MTRLFVLFVIWGSFLPRPVEAAQGPQRAPVPDVGDVIGYDEFDAPSGVDYGYSHLWRCLQVPGGGNLLEKNCWGDQTEEDNTREEVKALDRVVRAGALTLGALAAGVEYIKSIVRSADMLYKSVQAIVHAFDMKRPEQTLYRLAVATDRFNAQLEMAEQVSLHYQLPTPNQRYGMIQTLAIRALALAADATEAAVSLSDQASGMQMRLDDDGRIDVYAVMGGSGDQARSRTDLPPLPDDAPGSAASFYAQTVASLPAGAASYASEYAPARLASLMLTGSESGSGEDAVCMFADDMGEDPAVIYQRAVIMAQGAQTAATPTLATIGEERDALNVIRMREIQMDRERSTRRLFASLQVF